MMEVVGEKGLGVKGWAGAHVGSRSSDGKSASRLLSANHLCSSCSPINLDNGKGHDNSYKQIVVKERATIFIAGRIKEQSTELR